MKATRLIGNLLQPQVSVPASIAAYAGASALGNAFEENQYQKGDNRLILESLLAGTGAGLGAYGSRQFLRKPVRRFANRTLMPRLRELGVTPNTRRIIRQLAPYAAGSTVVGTAAGIGGGAVAPALSSAANLVGLPAFSNRQQDYYEEDYKSSTDALTEEDILLLQELLRGQNV